MLAGDKEQILVIDDEKNFRVLLADFLAGEGYEVHEAEDAQSGIAYLAEHHIDMVLTDLAMGEDRSAGMEVLRASRREAEGRPVLLITGQATISSAVEAMKLGAFDYVTKPIDFGDLGRLVAQGLRTRELQGKAATYRPAAGDAGVRFGILSRSPAMREVFNAIEKVAGAPTTVLITGESGTGKELVARALHENGQRRSFPFIALNCAAIPRELVEDELFGHEKGAFTSAATTRMGKFEIAQGGTLFLDEIGEMPVEMQAKLLRVLQERKIERIGRANKVPIEVDVRVIAATNVDLKRQRAEGRFRDDLFYRLAKVEIALPPLRERDEDIPLLCDHFIALFNERDGRDVAGIEAEALEVLMEHAWPGNIRELENVIEHAMLFADGPRIRLADLPLALREQADGTPVRAEAAPDLDVDGGLKENLRAVKHAAVEAALSKSGGNVTRAAKLLKMSRKGLQNLLKELKEKKPR